MLAAFPFGKGWPTFLDFLNSPLGKGQPMCADFLDSPLGKEWSMY